jgi:hypothetical protein
MFKTFPPSSAKLDGKLVALVLIAKTFSLSAPDSSASSFQLLTQVSANLRSHF